MAEYCVYFLDKVNHITDRREIDADSDAEAVKAAQQWTNGLAIEVWCGPILIETIEPTHKSKRD